MDLVLYILLLILGMVFLVKGADFFVDGASSIAKRLRVPSLIIGLTIVALGTSLPELAVSVVAAINHKVDMSVGNVAGSNIFNILVVLGVSAIVAPVAIDKKILKFEFPFLLVVSAFLLIISCVGERAVTWYIGLILVILAIIYIVVLILRTKKENAGSTKKEEVVIKLSTPKAILALILGAIMIIVGGEAVNRSAVFIAKFCGMSEQLIALTIVAIGTSLPELVTSMVAAKKGENDIALGNVIGSNILNIVFILGISSLIYPLTIKPDLLFNLIVMVAVAVLLMVMALITQKKKGISRICGVILVSIYVIYTAYLICVQLGVINSIL